MLDRVRLSLLLTGTLLQSVMLAGVAEAQDGTGGLSQGATVLDDVVVETEKATQSDEHAESADRALSEYIDRSEIERTQPQSTRDLFAGNAAITVGGGHSIAQKVYVNGVDENNLSVSIDGVKQGNRVFHHTSTNHIDPELLKAARVDPGVAPADAGFGALGGSIVYETVDVPDLLLHDRNFGAFSTTAYETNGSTFSESAAAYGRHEGFELLGYAKFAKGDDYEDGNGFAIPGTGADSLSLLGKIAYETQSGYRFELKGQQLTDDSMRPYRANLAALRGAFTTRQYDITRRNFSFNFGKEDLEGYWNPKVVVGYSENDYSIPVPYNSESTAGTWTAKVENVFKLSEGNTITAGLDLLSEQAEYVGPGQFYEESSQNYGAYVQARLQPFDRLKVSFGGRADSNNFEGIDGTELDNFGLSGNAYGEFMLLDGLSINAGYSNVFGGTDLEETFVFVPTWNYANLDPVRSDNVTAGVKFERNGWFAEGNVFNTRFFDYRENVSNVDFSSYGFNLAAGYSWADGFARVSFSDTKQTLSNGAVSSYALINIGAAVGQVISAEIAHTFQKIDLTIGASLDAALENDAFASSGSEPIAGFAVVNAYAEYKPKQFEALSLRLGVDNIFDETYADRATYGQEYATITPMYEPGRSFRLSGTLRY
ncbi:TonB-dependent receptor plug domain-containing protein [Roseibium limicola]|uniref:TonB-dependent receptor n=1 Tax=Roseibium limicola TaxID=2816037 RepID=A0A939J837_9HYPH|nr:TonB-dependent receptor [Roseibium limicola]MBO0343958.1 TonB-dependent receptor [Roseibium limicola]